MSFNPQDESAYVRTSEGKVQNEVNQGGMTRKSVTHAKDK
jgi:hypothetical protein